MIASVTGRVARVELDHVVLTTGGVGLLVHTTPATAAELRHGAEATLSTSLVVREDSLTLYGFAADDARSCFELVQTVSGVGPRLALAMLAVLSPEELRVAVAAGHLTTLTRVPGVGKKGAERLVLELRDKIGAPTGAAAAAAPQASGASAEEAWRSPVTEALVGLGWSAKQAQSGLDAVAGQLGDEPDMALALRAALRELGR